jgi:hypothetical protein
MGYTDFSDFLNIDEIKDDLKSKPTMVKLLMGMMVNTKK